MAWVAIIALAAWVFHLSRQVETLKRRAGMASSEDAAAADGRRAFDPKQPLWPGPAAVLKPEAASPPLREPAAVTPLREPVAEPPPEEATWKPALPRPAIAAATDRPALVPLGRSASSWMAENGLAWIGGGALALGGLLLVAYAAEQGVFTPAWRIGAAVAAGLAMLAGGEVVRRGVGLGKLEVGRNPLVAALASGAGAATLYAAIWAAQALYGFLPLAAAAALLTLISVGLLALAALHGEALGLLAVAGAFAVPVVSRPERWQAGALDGYLALLCLTGFAAAIRRRSPRTGWATLAGAVMWAAWELSSADAWRGPLSLLLLPPVLALVAFETEERGPADGPRPWTGGHAVTLVVGVLAASLLAPWLWSDGRPAEPVAGLAAACGLSLVTAAGLRRVRLPGWLMVAPAASACIGLVLALTSAFPGRDQIGLVWAGLAAAGVLAGSSLAVALAGRRDRWIAGAGAIGAAVIVALATAALPGSVQAWRWALLAAGATALFGAAAALARSSGRPGEDAAAALWIGASAALLLYAVEAAVPGRRLSAAYAAAALGYAALAGRLGWRGLVEAAAAAALASLAALFAPGFAAAALTGRLGLGEVVAVAGLSAGLLSAGSRLLHRREDAATAAEGLSTVALLAGLTGAFLALRVLGLPRGAGPAMLEPFTEASLRTVLLLAAGWVLTPAGTDKSQTARPLRRWRSRLLLAAGAAHGLTLEGVSLNPWWGSGGPVAGPPLIDALALGLLAPALLLAAAARRGARSTEKGEGVVTVGTALAGLAFALLWLALELRRLFHGPVLPGAFSVDECAAYGLAGLTVAWSLQRWDARRAPPSGGASRSVAEVAGWLAPAPAAWLLGYVASPWWGPLAAPLRGPLQAALLLALYAAAVGVAGALGRDWRIRGRAALARAAAVTAVAVAFALLTLLIRLGYRGLDMRASLREAGAETWTYSAAWALYGVAVVAGGVRTRSAGLRWAGLVVLLATTAKVLLFDLARLDGVVRAGSFLALGALLLLAALLARRWNAVRPAGEVQSSTVL